MSIGYEDVQVTEELLQEYELKKAKAEGWGKYGRFKAWLYYANLRRRQLQGLHECVLEGNSLKGERRLHCICGMFFQSSDLKKVELISKKVKIKTKSLRLDEVQQVKGHLNLDDFKSITVALLVDFLWEPEIGDYLWTAFCQECGKQIYQVENLKARAFVDLHNKSCGGGAYVDYSE